MTLMLAIDTTAGTSVSVLHQGKVLAEIHHDSGMKHAELIGNAIKSVLAVAGVRASDLTCVAVGRGPALFTGLRVGIAAAMMLADGLEIPLFGVISHDALALELLTGRASQQPLLVTTDARRGEVYWAVYLGLDQNGLPICADGPQVGKLDAVRAQLAETLGDFEEVTSSVSATWVARLADFQLAAGTISEDVSAMYLRAPDATPPKPSQILGGQLGNSPQFSKRVSG